MTDLPKLTFREYQKMMDTLRRQAEQAKPAAPQPENVEITKPAVPSDDRDCEAHNRTEAETGVSSSDEFDAGTLNPQWQMTGPGSFTVDTVDVQLHQTPPPDTPKPWTAEPEPTFEQRVAAGEFRVETPKTKPPKPWQKDCGCRCAGCTSTVSSAKHCLQAPCTRTRNRRSAAEIAAAGRYTSGRARRAGTKPGAPSRTPEQIEAAQRYPSGRIKPDRSKWVEREKYPNPKPQGTRRSPKPKAVVVPQDDPLAPMPTHYVHATRGETTIRLPVYSQAEAVTVANRLAGFGWGGGVHGDTPMIFEGDSR